jgi:hypothetical protein
MWFGSSAFPAYERIATDYPSWRQPGAFFPDWYTRTPPFSPHIGTHQRRKRLSVASLFPASSLCLSVRWCAYRGYACGGFSNEAESGMYPQHARACVTVD